MIASDIANFADIGISLAGGVLATLFGFRVIGKAKSMDSFYAKWGKHLRWLGPACIVFALIQHFVLA